MGQLGGILAMDGGVAPPSIGSRPGERHICPMDSESAAQVFAPSPSQARTPAHPARIWVRSVAPARQGDMDAFRDLYEHTRPDLHNAIARLVDDEHDAHEIVQQTYVKAWQGLQELREDAAFAGWLRRIAMNLLRDHWRRTNRFHELPADDDPDTPPDPEPDPSERLAAHQGLAGLDRAVQTLPEMFRLPVVLHYLDERSVEEVAGILDVPRGTVLSRLSRARARLKEYLLRGNHAP